MKLINAKLGDGNFIPDVFVFDDGFRIDLRHSDLILNRILITVYLLNDEIICFAYEERNNIKTLDYVFAMDHVNYIITCYISYIHYYKTYNEWIDPYKCCYERHEHLDIKHKLWNLRRVKTLSWPHLDIIRNINQYCDYALVSRFARELIINFYSRFMKLSRLKNNKQLSWILDVTDSFLHYGFAIPSDEYSFKCSCKDITNPDKSCIMLDTNTLKIWYHDEPEKEYTSCRYQKPNLKNTDLICEHIQRYYAKHLYDRQYGIRQNTEDICKMQLTDNEHFTFYGAPPFVLFDKFKNRMHIKTSSSTGFQHVLYYLGYCINVVNPIQTIPMPAASVTSANDVSVWVTKINSQQFDTFYLTSQDSNILIAIDCLIDFLKNNKQHINKFIKQWKLDSAYIGILLNIAKHNLIFQSGELSSIGVKLERYRLLNS